MNRQRILWIVAAVAMVLLLIIWIYPCRDDFEIKAASWSGTSDCYHRTEAAEVNSLAELPSQPEGTALILIPYTPFTAGELDELVNYVEDGGTLILMDDYGYGNEVLESLGLSYRFSGDPLLDPLINYKNEQFPKIMDFEPSPLTKGVNTIVCNHATCLIDVPESEAIATSSSFSFLDKDGSSSYDADVDERGPFVMVAITQLGKGRLIAISDPSIIINSMLDMEDNYTLIKNATELSTSAPQIFLDQSHLPSSDLSRVKEDLGIARGALSYPAVVFVVAGAILALAWRPVWRENKRR